MRTVVTAGTFDNLHVGHMLMLWYAFKLGDRVLIGVMRDESLKSKIFREKLKPYEERVERLKKLLEDWVKTVFKGKKYEIHPITGPYDIITEVEDIDFLVVSEETLPRALAINSIRRNRGFREVEILVIPMVRAKDSRPIASHRIRVGEIDSLGNSRLEGVESGCSKPKRSRVTR